MKYYNKKEHKLKKYGFATSLLTLTLCISLTAHADAQEQTLIYLNAGYAAENNFAEVELCLENNDGISAYSIEICYDHTALSFVDAYQGNALNGGTFYCNGSYSENSVRIVWSDAHNRSGDGTAAVLRFKTANDTADTDSPVSFGKSYIASELDYKNVEARDGMLKIAKKITPGDVTLDGGLHSDDVVLLNMYLLGSADISNTAQANAEVTGDKKIDSNDCETIMNYVSMVSEEI